MSDEPRTPPGWLEGLVRRSLPSGLSGEGALGDLAEAFARRHEHSRMRAHLWYLWQAVSIIGYRMMRGSGVGGPETDSDVVMDLRWSLRSMARHPGFALTVVAVLGLGFGANVAVFSVVDGTLRNTSWWSEPDRTVAIWPDNLFSAGQLDLYAEQQTVYRSLGAYQELAFALQLPDGESRSVTGVVMTPALFGELEAQPILGRALTEEDGLFGAEPVAVLGHRLWRRSFGADPAIVGTRIEIGGSPVTVVGVQGPGGAAPGGRSELWVPLVPDPRDDDYFRAQSYLMVGALRDGASLDDARDDLMAFTDRLSDLYPMFYPEGFARGIADVAWANREQRRLVATPLLLLFAGTGLLLMATALNVGNLLLGRAVDRGQELAVRASLGASRGRVVRQLLMEGSVLTAVAMVLALVSATIGGEWLAALFTVEAVVAASPVLSPTVLAFSGLVGLVGWLVLNGVPVAHFLRSQSGDLRVRTTRPGGSTLQRALVAVQAALATLLLVSATLLVATVDNLRSVPLGFDSRGIAAVELSTPADRVASPAVARELYGRLVDRVGRIPGVEAVGLTGWLPLRAEAPPTPINLRSAPVDPREAVRAPMHMVDPGFFEVLDVRPVEGRLLQSTDIDPERPSAVVVNETLARTLWPDQPAVGRMIAIDPHAWSSWAPVVGVVPDIRSGSIAGAASPALYVALAESPSRDVTLLVRTTEVGRAAGGAGAPEGVGRPGGAGQARGVDRGEAGTPGRGGGRRAGRRADAAGLAPALRRAVSEVDPLVPIRSITNMEAVVRAAYETAWVVMGLLTVLAALATALGAIGTYAVLAHQVARSKRDIGVRMALGARPGSVVGRIVRSGLILTGTGIAVGSLAAVGATRFLESLLYGVSALAPSAFAAPVVTLSVAAVLAAWLPAVRAGRLPPAEVLRGE